MLTWTVTTFTIDLYKSNELIPVYVFSATGVRGHCGDGGGTSNGVIGVWHSGSTVGAIDGRGRCACEGVGIMPPGGYAGCFGITFLSGAIGDGAIRVGGGTTRGADIGSSRKMEPSGLRRHNASGSGTPGLFAYHALRASLILFLYML